MPAAATAAGGNMPATLALAGLPQVGLDAAPAGDLENRERVVLQDNDLGEQPLRFFDNLTLRGRRIHPLHDFELETVAGEFLGTEGNIILTRLPVPSSTTFQMHPTSDTTAMYSNRFSERATVRVGSVSLNVFQRDYYSTTNRTIRNSSRWRGFSTSPGHSSSAAISIPGGDEPWITTIVTQ
jgi:hypothetical protein